MSTRRLPSLPVPLSPVSKYIIVCRRSCHGLVIQAVLCNHYRSAGGSIWYLAVRYVLRRYLLHYIGPQRIYVFTLCKIWQEEMTLSLVYL